MFAVAARGQGVREIARQENRERRPQSRECHERVEAKANRMRLPGVLLLFAFVFPAFVPRANADIALNWTRQGTNIALSGATNNPSFVLQFRTNLYSGNWTTLCHPPIVQGLYTTNQLVTNGMRFYRLTSTAPATNVDSVSPSTEFVGNAVLTTTYFNWDSVNGVMTYTNLMGQQFKMWRQSDNLPWVGSGSREQSPAYLYQSPCLSASPYGGTITSVTISYPGFSDLVLNFDYAQ